MSQACLAHVILAVCLPIQPGQARGRARTFPASPFKQLAALRRQHEDHPIATATHSPSLPTVHAIMNAFRVARAARPAFNALRTVQRRGYADVAADKIQLSLALPHQVRLEESETRRNTWNWEDKRRKNPGAVKKNDGFGGG